MKRWEYRSEAFQPKGLFTSKRLDKFGLEGWELVAVTRLGFLGGHMAHFKRELDGRGT